MHSLDKSCGVTCWHPKFLQRFANSKTFIVVYGLLGTVQAMSFVYFVVILTTLEKRFQIPSSTTGKIVCLIVCFYTQGISIFLSWVYFFILLFFDKK